MRTPPAIEAFGQGGFRVDGLRHDGSLLILEDVARHWPAGAPAALDSEALAAVIAAGPGAVELVILGAGPVMAPPPRAVREALRKTGIGLEVLDTPSAIKLYNMLASEGRRVAAALIAV